MVRLILPILLFSSPVAAEECEVPMEVTSPCSGVLLPTSAATLGLKCLKVKLPELQALLEKERSLCSTDKKALQATIDLEKERNQKLMDMLLEKKPVPPASSFLDSRTFWLGTGVVAGVTITLSILKIATEVLD